MWLMFGFLLSDSGFHQVTRHEYALRGWRPDILHCRCKPSHFISFSCPNTRNLFFHEIVESTSVLLILIKFYDGISRTMAGWCMHSSIEMVTSCKCNAVHMKKKTELLIRQMISILALNPCWSSKHDALTPLSCRLHAILGNPGHASQIVIDNSHRQLQSGYKKLKLLFHRNLVNVCAIDSGSILS